VRAYRSLDNRYSSYSNSVTGATSLCPPPSAPSNLTLTNVGQNSLNLAWQDNAIDETGYRMERSSDNGSTWIEIAQLAGGSINYNNTGLVCQTSYQYRVRAYRATDNQFSSYSNSTTGTTTACPVNAPSNVLVSSSPFSLLLSWNDNSNNETDLELQRNNGNWQTIA